MDRGRRMVPALVVGLVAAVMAWSWMDGRAPQATPRPCVRAVLVDDRLRCDDELPDDPAAMCPGPGPRSSERISAGDAFDTAQLCARSFVAPYASGHGWSRMPPEQLAALGQPVDVNRATLAELESLPRVGPTLARHIAAGRPYADIDALERVRGIGPATLRQLRDRAVVVHSDAP